MVRHVPALSIALSAASLALLLAQPAAAETVTIGIGTQDTTTNTVTAGTVVRQLHLLEKYLPTDGKYAGVSLKGVLLRVRDRQVYDPTKLAVALLVAIRAVHPAEFQFRAQSFDRLAAGPELRTAIEAGQSPQAIWNSWTGDLARFREARAKYLIY